MSNNYASRVALVAALSEKLCETCYHNRTGQQCPIYDHFLAGHEPEEISYQSGIRCTSWEARIA